MAADAALTTDHSPKSSAPRLLPRLGWTALRVLTRFEAPELVIRTLLDAVSDEVRNQDAWTLIALLLERRTTPQTRYPSPSSSSAR